MSNDKKRVCYLRQPHAAELNIAVAGVCRALNEHCAYLVGSVMERPDFNDIDVVVIMDDSKFEALFGKSANTEVVPFSKWFNASSSALLSKMTGLKVDFRVQKMSRANEVYGGKMRDPIGMECRGEVYDPAWLKISDYPEDDE